MAQFLAVSVSAEIEEFIEAGDALELQRRLDQSLAALSTGITSVSLSGGGDGDKFIVRIGHVSPAAPSSLTSVQMVAYEAADAQELPKARDNAINNLTLPAIKQAEEVAGASQGTKFMGLIVTGVSIVG